MYYTRNTSLPVTELNNGSLTFTIGENVTALAEYGILFVSSFQLDQRRENRTKQSEIEDG